MSEEPAHDPLVLRDGSHRAMDGIDQGLAFLERCPAEHVLQVAPHVLVGIHVGRVARQEVHREPICMKTGPSTAAMVEEIMRRRVHPQQGYMACLGILHLNRDYEPERIEAACGRALRMRACTYKSVKAILKNKLDLSANESEEPQGALPLHENVRGAGYYGDRDKLH